MEYHRPARSESESKDRTLIRILLAGLGCLFLVAAVVAFLFGRFLFSVRGPNRVVQTHLEALNNGNFEKAYGYFDVKFRQDTSLKQFRKEMDEFSSLLPFRESTLNRVE